MTAYSIKTLHREHANMGRVLTLIRLQLDLLARHAPPDYALLGNSLYYMRKYPSVVHHPKEDLIFEKLLQLGVPLLADIRELQRQHAEIYSLEDRLIEAALAAETGNPAENMHLTSLGQLYLRTQAQHMQTEESVIFPVALRRLKAHQWKSIGAAFRKIDDPVFGLRVGARYQQLHDFLLRTAAEDEQRLNSAPHPTHSTLSSAVSRRP